MTTVTAPAGPPGVAGPSFDLMLPGLTAIPDLVTTTFNPDGSIAETYPAENVTVLTTFNADGSIIETFSGAISITRTTTINPDGSITEVLQ